MIRISDNQTDSLFDPREYFGPKWKKLLYESWAGLFREQILFAMPVNKIARFFKEDFGRFTKEQYAAPGSFLIRQMHDLTDEEAVSRFSFNIQWHYNPDIPGESYDYKYLSLKTLWKLCTLVMREKLNVELFNHTTEAPTKAFQVDATRQRIGSVHILSNTRRLRRIGIFSRSILPFLVNLKRRRPDIFETIDKEFVNRFLSEKALICFLLVKPTESGKTLKGFARDLFTLVRFFEKNDGVKSLHSYNTLLRVLKSHCPITEAKDDQPREVQSACIGDVHTLIPALESTFSSMDKTTGVKQLRVRGLPAVSCFAGLKAIAVNTFRAASARKVLTPPSKTPEEVKSGLISAKFYFQDTIFVFKAQFRKNSGVLGNHFTAAKK